MGFAANVYAEQLLSRAHGWPLWEPEPTKEGEVLIGDVGYIYDGAFYRLFNVTFSEDHEINKGGVPEGFVPLRFSQRLHAARDPYLSAGPLCSRSVQSISAQAGAGAESVDLALRFKCTKEQGAVLILKDDARKEAIHPNKTFVDYIRAHHESWYNFAQSVMELDIAREDIVLVRGWVKTSEWAVAAFTERGQSHEISFHGQLGHLAQAGLSLSMTESNMMSVETRSGPHRRPFAQLPEPRTSSTGKNVEVEPDNRRDQCVFLSYYKIKYRKFLPNKIAAAADPNSLPESDEAPTGSSSAEVISEPAPSKLRSDPIDDVLSYILACSDADVAITSDGDIHELCNGEDWPEDLVGLLRERAPRIDVENGTGILSLEEAITRARREEVEDDVVIHPHEALALVEAPVNAEPDPQPQGSSEDVELLPEQVTQPVAEEISEEVPEQTTEQTPEQEPEPEPEQDVIISEDPTESNGVQETEENEDSQSSQDMGDSDQGEGSSSLRDIPTIHKAPENLRGGAILLRRNLQEARAFEWPHRILLDTATECGAVCSTALSPDGRYVAAGFEDCIVRVWNMETGVLLYHLEGHRDNVWGVTFSPDGRLLATGSADHTAIIWNAITGRLLWHLKGHTSDVWSLAFSPDGTRLATGSVDCTAILWDPRSGQIVQTLGGHNAVVLNLAFTPNSTRILTAADDKIRVWDGHNGLELMTLHGHSGVIWCMDVSHDGYRIVSGSEDHTCRVWSIESGEELVTIREHSGPVWSVKFSPDAQRICSGSYDSTVAVTNSYTGARIHHFQQRPAVVHDVSFTPEGDYIAAGCADGGVRVWDAWDGQFVAEVQGHLDKAKEVTFANDGDSLVSASDDGTVRVWSLLDMLRL